VDGRALGGSDELAALERDGKLDALLETSAPPALAAAVLSP
jgi:hypothetical protein